MSAAGLSPASSIAACGVHHPKGSLPRSPSRAVGWQSAVCSGTLGAIRMRCSVSGAHATRKELTPGKEGRSGKARDPRPALWQAEAPLFGPSSPRAIGQDERTEQLLLPGREKGTSTHLPPSHRTPAHPTFQALTEEEQ